MLEYAAQDTRYLLQLRDHMKSELQRRGRWRWAEEEFARLEGTRWEAEEEMESFLRLKGARDLTRRELAVLRDALDAALPEYKRYEDRAEALLRNGESPVNPKLDKSELAAWTTVASIILNLDETMTKQ
jgi:ribonuclease D